MAIFYLDLESLGKPEVVGIYTVGGTKNRLPDRMRWLHPEALWSWHIYAMGQFMVVSDMFRSPEASLRAVAEGRGAMPPGRSGHNFGLSIDLDVDATMKKLGAEAKKELDAWMEGCGWFCHRRDHKRGKEDWHYNYLGQTVIVSYRVRTTMGYIEAKIQELYGSWMHYHDTHNERKEAQMTLRDLGLYSGAIDGKIGPLSKEGIRAFQRTWNLRQSGKLEDKRTWRTLAYLSAYKAHQEAT